MGAYIGVYERFGSSDEDTNGHRFEQVRSHDPALESAYREIAELKEKLAQEKLYLEDEICGAIDFEGIVGQSSALRHVLNLVETVAPTDSTVLLLGETGTGKELIAHAIHDRSHRKERTFVKLNCAAIPTGLLESELFGYERGAFTGAIAQKIGRLELADQGTLFLDEVGDIPIEIQPKLLRALQEREFERLGSNRTKKVDVRLVAATNRDLEKMMENREFRSDLYYRLNVFPMRIPPLRERPGDIPLLVRYFTQKYGRRMQRKIESIPTVAMRKLSSWHWPGNIRELENFIERSVILTHGAALQAPIAELGYNGRNTWLAGTREANEHDEIVRTLKGTRGRVGGRDGAAARMGIKRTTLISRMKKFGITRLGQPEVGVGLHPGDGGAERLPHLVGRGRALEVILGANDFDGDTAERYGYVNRALPGAELDNFVDALARRIASFDRRAIAAAKNLVNRVSLPSADQLLDAITSFETALTWPAAQQRIQNLLEHRLQREVDFEDRWPEVLDTLLDETHENARRTIPRKMEIALGKGPAGDSR